MADFRLWGQVEQFPVAWVFEKVIQMFEYEPCCMDHPEGCYIIVFFNTGDNLDAT